MFKTPPDKDTTEKISQIIDQINLQLIEGRTENALRTAYRQLAPYLDVNPIIGMLSSWNQAEQDRLQQLISQDDFSVNRARVSTLFRRFMDELQQALPTARKKEAASDATPVEDPAPPVFTDKKQILVLYATEDLPDWRELQKHFFALRKLAGLHWSDALLDKPTTLTDDTVYLEKWIDAADKVLCLISPNILALPTYALAERAAAAHKLIPLKIRKVDLAHTIFEPLGSLPSDNRFASDWPDPNAAYVDIAQGLRSFLQKLLSA